MTQNCSKNWKIKRLTGLVEESVISNLKNAILCFIIISNLWIQVSTLSDFVRRWIWSCLRQNIMTKMRGTWPHQSLATVCFFFLSRCLETKAQEDSQNSRAKIALEDWSDLTAELEKVDQRHICFCLKKVFANQFRILQENCRFS